MRKYLPQLLTLIASAAVSGWLFASDHGREGGALDAADHKAWRAECGSCHLPFPPGMLPERSWRKMMDGLDKHFGENAGLDEATRRDIAAFLTANAADRSGARRARKVAASIPTSQTPLRITETAWFDRKHDELAAAVWTHKDVGSRANCAACHRRADGGSYSEREIAVPGRGRWEH